MSKYIPILLFFSIMILLSSCIEKKTDDPNEAYKLWAGEAPKEVHVIHGKYWQSAHFTKEYIMYLELKAPVLWRKELIKQNNLVESKERINVPYDAPVWFKPDQSFRTLKSPEDREGSVYFEDTLTGRMFFYEIQL